MSRLVALVVVLTACDCGADVVATLPAADGSTAAPDDADTLDDSGRQGLCEGSGPTVNVGDGASRLRCGGTIAETTFRHALCLCTDYVSSHTLDVDSFDSREGSFTSGQAGGSVGINGALDANGALNIGGALRVADPRGIGLGAAAELDVGGQLQTGGRLNGQTRVSVGTDATVLGDIQVNELTVAGELRLGTDSMVMAGALDVGSETRFNGSVLPPCDCDAPLDVAGLVAARRNDNDNDLVDLGSDDLSNLAGEMTLELPCGRFFIDRVGGNGPLNVVSSGRAVLYIDGDFSLGQPLRIQLEGESEIDIFIAGNVVSGARWELGDGTAASRVRIYVGGTGTVELAGGGFFEGNLYAPRAELVTPASLEVFGSIFARRLAASGPLTIHYDRAVLQAGEECAPPPNEECDTCADCRNQACIDGQCGDCRTDADCCAPLVCTEGTCLPELF